MACCGTPVFDVPKPTGSGTPKPISGPTKPAARRPTFHNSTLHHISFKAQNPDTLTVRDAIVLIFSIYAVGWCGFFTLREAWTVLFVRTVSQICPESSLGGCLWVYVMKLVFGVLGGWVREVLPWGLVAALGVFWGEEAVRWWKGRKSV